MDRLFVGIFPAGVSYADRGREEHGDYARVAFLPYRTLELEESPGADPGLLAQARVHAASLQARRGQELRVSTCGQTVRLGAP